MISEQQEKNIHTAIGRLCEDSKKMHVGGRITNISVSINDEGHAFAKARVTVYVTGQSDWDGDQSKAYNERKRSTRAPYKADGSTDLDDESKFPSV